MPRQDRDTVHRHRRSCTCNACMGIYATHMEAARLRDAAPTLLEALERIVRLEDEHDGEPFEDTFFHAQQIARAAIVKATGDQP